MRTGGFICDICGQEDSALGRSWEFAPSSLKVEFGFPAQHKYSYEDVCKGCCDELAKTLSEKIREMKEKRNV